MFYLKGVFKFFSKDLVVELWIGVIIFVLVKEKLVNISGVC